MNQSVLYLECNSGISGDMTVAALLDLGADRQVLLSALASLPLDGYSIEINDVYKSGLRACDFNVILDHDNHDHDMEYLHGHAHSHGHEHEHEFSHEHSREHGHEHNHELGAEHAAHTHATGASEPHAHTHAARNLRDITEIINGGALTDRARSLALRIFRILAEAEAFVHGKTVDEVHFHEVGAVDSIVDIVAAAVCLDNLDPARVVVSPLTDGTGQIRCQHGLIPVPVPAVAAIAAQTGLSLKLTGIEGELVTPTGAAIAAALQAGSLSADMSSSGGAPLSDASQAAVGQTGASQPVSNSCHEPKEADLLHCAQTRPAAGLPDEFCIRKIGLGAGKRDYATTGVLRAMLLEARDKALPTDAVSSRGTGRNDDSFHSLQNGPDRNAPADTILSLESNIDDCTGEALSFTMQELFAHGALDVFYVPIYMKKNRPAYLLRVLCRADDRAVLESIIFKNTTTIGIRAQEMQRTKLPRQIVSVDTPWGKADVKCCTHNGEIRYYPENDSVSELARRNQTGFPEMYHQIQEYAGKVLDS